MHTFLLSPVVLQQKYELMHIHHHVLCTYICLVLSGMENQGYGQIKHSICLHKIISKPLHMPLVNTVLHIDILELTEFISIKRQQNIMTSTKQLTRLVDPGRYVFTAVIGLTRIR